MTLWILCFFMVSSYVQKLLNGSRCYRNELNTDSAAEDTDTALRKIANEDQEVRKTRQEFNTNVKTHCQGMTAHTPNKRFREQLQKCHLTWNKKHAGLVQKLKWGLTQAAKHA